jgi:hypothetical protein
VKIGGVGFCHSPTELPTEFGQLLKKTQCAYHNYIKFIDIKKTISVLMINILDQEK